MMYYTPTSIILHFLKYTHTACCHLFVVGGLRTSMTPIAMLAGVFNLLVGPPKSDRLKD